MASVSFWNLELVLVSGAPTATEGTSAPFISGSVASDVRNRKNGERLTDRERIILRLVVQNFIRSAGPVGSKYLHAHAGLGISPASIRSAMNSLEAKGYLDHPYTSAGRIPTNLGYRMFVDSLMKSAFVSNKERLLISNQLSEVIDDSDTLFRESSKLLARLAQLLGVVLSPQMTSGILERLEIVQISSDRVMFVLSIEGGLIRTIVLHIATEIKRDRLDRLVELLNERLAGLTLDEIRRTCVPRVIDLQNEETGIVQLILNETSQLFDDAPNERTVKMEGTTFVLAQPEFTTAESMRAFLGLIDDAPSVVGLLEDEEVQPNQTTGKATVRIGHSMVVNDGEEERVHDLSIVTAPYYRSKMQGTIGVIGPTRMDYARMIALVEGVALLMSWPNQGEFPHHSA